MWSASPRCGALWWPGCMLSLPPCPCAGMYAPFVLPAPAPQLPAAARPHTQLPRQPTAARRRRPPAHLAHPDASPPPTHACPAACREQELRQIRKATLLSTVNSLVFGGGPILISLGGEPGCCAARGWVALRCAGLGVWCGVAWPALLAAHPACIPGLPACLCSLPDLLRSGVPPHRLGGLPRAGPVQPAAVRGCQGRGSCGLLSAARARRRMRLRDPHPSAW